MVINCPKCGKENKSTNLKCEHCQELLIDSKTLDNNLIDSSNNTITSTISIPTKKIGCLSNAIIIILVIPWILVGLALIGIGLAFSILNYKNTKGYEKTAAILKDFTNCDYDTNSEICEAIYTYEVDGITYSVSPSMATNRENFKEKDTVYYNPNNPSESVIRVNLNVLTIIGFVILCIIILIFMIKNYIIKKIAKGKESLDIKVRTTY